MGFRTWWRKPGPEIRTRSNMSPRSKFTPLWANAVDAGPEIRTIQAHDQENLRRFSRGLPTITAVGQEQEFRDILVRELGEPPVRLAADPTAISNWNEHIEIRDEDRQIQRHNEARAALDSFETAADAIVRHQMYRHALATNALRWNQSNPAISISRPSENSVPSPVVPGTPTDRNQEGVGRPDFRTTSPSVEGQLTSHPDALVSNPAPDNGETARH